MKNKKYIAYSRIAMIMVFILSYSFPVDSQTTVPGNSPQFNFPAFEMSKIKLKDGKVQSLSLNYNTLSEKLVYEKNNKLFDFVNPEIIDTVFFPKNIFVPMGEAFYELLVNKPIALYVQYKSDIVFAGTSGGYGSESQVAGQTSWANFQTSAGKNNLTIPDDYKLKVSIVYWIRKGDELLSFKTERQFLKIFSENETELKKYIKQNRIQFDNLSNMAMLVEQCNTMNK